MYVTSLLLETATAAKQRGGWEMRSHGGFLGDDPKPALYLLSLRALLCRVYYADSLHSLMHRRD